MEFVHLSALEVGAGTFPFVGEGSVEHTTPERRQRVVDLLAPPGSIVLLVGESGAGKRRLAQDAVETLSQQLGQNASQSESATSHHAPDQPSQALELISLIAPSNPLSTIASHFGVPETLGHFAVHLDEDDEHSSERFAEQLIDTVTEIASDPGRGDPVLLVQGIDRYSPQLTCLIGRVMNIAGVRLIATAHGLSGAAAHLSSDARAHVVTVAPLTMQQSHRYLNRLLGVEHVEYHSLRRWYQLTEGNALSLMLLALALDREGHIGRSRGVGYELPGPELVPREIWDYLQELCSDQELRTLELIALVEPVGESKLVREIDPGSLSRLRSRGLVKEQHQHGRGTQLSLSHKLLAAAVREQMTTERASAISSRLFDALSESLNGPAAHRRHDLLVRLVRLGLDAGRPLPAEWLSETLDEHAHVLEPSLRLRTARALLTHPDATTNQFAAATLQLVTTARAAGEYAVLERSWEDVREAVDRLRRSAGESSMLRIRLELQLIDHYAFDLGDPQRALAQLADLGARVAGDGVTAEGSDAKLAAVRGAHALLLASLGKLREAEDYLPHPGAVASMRVEWERGSARLVSSLLLCQRGQFSDALRIADQASSYATIGEKPQAELVEVLQFSSFLTFWACGAAEAARYRLALMLEEAQHDTAFTGLAEVAAALMSLADGKWRLAAQRGERVVDRLTRHDPHGLLSLGLAAHSLALAALGEKEESRRAIRSAEVHRPGPAQTVAGFVRVMTLRARQWNADDGAAQFGLQLAAWARGQDLATVELLALHQVAVADRDEAVRYLTRIRALAAVIEPPMSAAILAHCEDIAAGVTAWESPSARALTELGVWMPLPATDELSAREREIALYAALGYSSRWIAEQFHLSVRTVDTHLRHVFTKLRVGGRDELRQWFRREHQTW
ncbi:LuxR C-terminal-related transcriptional regulator [Leucobacter sp. HY1908]